MTAVRRAVLFVVCVALLAPNGLRAQEPDVPDTTERPVGDDASALLEKIAGADGASYSARQLVVYLDDPQSNALLDVRSSKDGRLVRARSGNDVTRHWSRSQAHDDAQASRVHATQPQVRVDPTLVIEKYEIAIGAQEKLLGVGVVPLTLSRRSDGTVVERWWVQATTGVMYKRELYNATGELVCLSTLIEMDWGDPGPPDPMASSVAGDVPQAAPAPDAPRRLAGGYELWRTYRLEVDGRPTEQWIYSDGLHALSVFRTRGGLRAPDGFETVALGPHAAFAGPGPGTWAWEGAGQTWVVVAEEPAIDPAALTQPFPKGGPSVWARLGSVWSRIGGGIVSVFA